VIQTTEYERRDATLRTMGYESYSRYLASPLWRKIRARVLKDFDGECFLCHESAAQVHHRSYDEATLKGDDTTQLVAICRTCHELGEFDSRGRKTSLHQCNERMRIAQGWTAKPQAMTRAQRRAKYDKSVRIPVPEKFTTPKEISRFKFRLRRATRLAKAGKPRPPNIDLSSWRAICDQLGRDVGPL
jgi:hypothetical protein